MNALSVKDISISFGGLQAVARFSLEVPVGGIYGLIGPNGAGKTTIFNLLTGIYSSDSGSILAFGSDITSKKPDEICRRGLARTFQNIRLFKNLTVEQNLLVALDHNPRWRRQRMSEALLRTSTLFKHEREKLLETKKLLQIVSLEEHAASPAGDLSYGAQRRLEIVRALGTGARLLLLDEPAAGMNAVEKYDLATVLRTLRDSLGVTLLLIEHDMGLVMSLCERIAVLDHGVKIAEGAPAEVQASATVSQAYLGSAENKKKNQDSASTEAGRE